MKAEEMRRLLINHKFTGLKVTVRSGVFTIKHSRLSLRGEAAYAFASRIFDALKIAGYQPQIVDSSQKIEKGRGGKIINTVKVKI